MKKLLLLCLLAAPVWGGEATISWKLPTTTCNGTPLTNLASVTMTRGQVKETLPLTQLSKTVTGLTPGLWWFSLAAVTAAGVSSEFVTVEKTILPEQFVTKSNNVYTFFRSGGNISVVKTNHTVPLGVVCDATQSVNGKYKVRLEDVVWIGPKLTAALADCG